MNSEITAASADAREAIAEKADAAGAVYGALAANPGATTAAIATAAGTDKKEARRELLALEQAGTATRAKGGKPGVPDTWTLTAAPDQPEAPAAEPRGADEPVSGDEPPEGADDTAEPAGTANEAVQPPDPAALAEAAEQVVAIAQAIADIGTALAKGNITAALDGIEKVREPAAQARRILKAAAKGKRRPARSPGTGTGVRPGALRDLVQAHLYDNPDTEFTPHQISKALDRSSGAVANALDRLVQLGIATPTSEKPRRFQLSPNAPTGETGQTAAEVLENPTVEPVTGTATEPVPSDSTETEITADAA